MTDPGDPHEPFVRPFLFMGAKVSMPDARPDGFAERDVRPYLITGGRVSTSDARVGVETVVVAIPVRNRRLGCGDALTFERAQILRECQSPVSVAEISSHLRVSLGVVRILVADLIADGVLDFATAQAHHRNDVQFIERLIDGVMAL